MGPELGQRRGDAADHVSKAGRDRLAGALGVTPEAPVASAHSRRASQFLQQCLTLDLGALAPDDVVVLVRA